MMFLNIFYFIALLCCMLISATKLFKVHYEIVMERAEVESLDTSQINASFGLHFYNRTTKSLHGFIHLLSDVKNDGYVLTKEYVLRNNEYKLTAIQGRFTIHETLQMDLLGSQSLFRGFVPPLVWPLKKGITYKLDNWLHDDKKVPFPYSPTGYWKSVINVYINKQNSKAMDICFYDHVTEVADF